jgi:hypothetical protein
MPSFRTPTQTPALQYSLAVILSVGPTFFTALRFRARIVLRTRLDWDDWLIVVALVGRTCIALFVLSMLIENPRSYSSLCMSRQSS